MDGNMTDAPESVALALGKLIGNVEGLTRTLTEQNITAAARKKEQDEAAIKNRDEFMTVFKEIRDDIRITNSSMQSHIEDDNNKHQIIAELKNWKDEVAPQINTMWDNTNKGKGAAWASGIFGTFIGGIIVTAIEYFKKG